MSQKPYLIETVTDHQLYLQCMYFNQSSFWAISDIFEISFHISNFGNCKFSLLGYKKICFCIKRVN